MLEMKADRGSNPGSIRLRTLALMLMVLLIVLSCSSNGQIDGRAAPSEINSTSSTVDSSPTTQAPPDTTESTTTIAPPRGPLGSGETVTIAFAGDASFQGLDSAVISDPAAVLRAIAPVLGDADITMVNLEAALGSGGTPEPKAFNFQTPAQSLDALKAAGVDLVTMANNHGMDFGMAGLESSLEIKAGGAMPILGIGHNAAEAYAPHVAEIKGQKLGFIAASDVIDASLMNSWTATDTEAGIASAKGDHQQRLLDTVAATRPEVDTLIVYLHFGTETQTCPNDRQRQLVLSLFGAGADIVVGSHAHRLQGVGFVGDKLVAYGLGNFIFRPGSAFGRESGVLVVSTTGSRVDSFAWRPAVIQGSVPVPLSGPKADAELAKMDRLAECAGVSATPIAPAAPDPAESAPPPTPIAPAAPDPAESAPPPTPIAPAAQDGG